jgi:nitrite reductase/ring-hydroxylating ferredoxin subunit
MTTEVANRRRFLEVVAAGTAAFVLPACGSSNSSQGSAAANVGDVEAGNVGSIAVGSLQAVGSQPVAIGRDAGGLYSMTLTCPHQGCNIATSGTVAPSGIVCACHGSQFNANGEVTMGPASAALAHYAVEVDASGTVVVHTAAVVDSSARTPVA